VGEDRISRDMERYTVRDAADILGITTGAVRNRLSRGTLQSVKEHGTVYILLPPRDTGDTPGESSALISHLEDEVRFLREELARKDAILLRMAESIPQLEAPPEASGSPETATEQPGRVGPQPAVESAEEGVQRPWWRRWFQSR
jgi:hypothetical protein